MFTLEVLGLLGGAVAIGLIIWGRKRSQTPKVKDIQSPKHDVAVEPKRLPLSKALHAWFSLLQTSSKDRSEWEAALIQSDLGPRLTDELLAKMNESSLPPREFLVGQLSEWILPAERTFELSPQTKPLIVFLIGVNGVGKTTTTVKIGNYFKSRGASVGVVGADTFRKAAIEQLQRGCERVGLDFFSQTGATESEGADPAAVVFDGLKKFQDRDLILVDTSGRLQNKKNLMEELKKMKRVADKSVAGAPHEVWMVMDSTLGQNAVNQGKAFHEAIGLTGLVLTKIDGLSRGGTVFQLFSELKTPIVFLGFGEQPDDLRPFAAKTFIEDLFDQTRTSF